MRSLYIRYLANEGAFTHAWQAVKWIFQDCTSSASTTVRAEAVAQHSRHDEAAYKGEQDVNVINYSLRGCYWKLNWFGSLSDPRQPFYHSPLCCCRFSIFYCAIEHKRDVLKSDGYKFPVFSFFKALRVFFSRINKFPAHWTLPKSLLTRSSSLQYRKIRYITFF